VWLGFYENAFRMMRECYEQASLHRWSPRAEDPNDRLAHGSFEEAFFPEPHIGVAGRNAARDWVVWSGYLPPAKGLPGDDLVPESNPFTLASYLLRCVALLKTLMLSVIGPPQDDTPGKPRPDDRSTIDEAIASNVGYDPIRQPELLVEWVGRGVRDGTLTLAGAALQVVTMAEGLLRDFKLSAPMVGSALNLLQALAAQARKQLQDVVSVDEGIRWKTEIIDIVMAIAVGLYRDRVLFQRRGLDAINNMDYREWLRKHGATESSVNSRFITGIYDLVFAYEAGNRRRPRLAAGVALRGALRMFFTYRGAMFWRMRSGMGDAVFAPLYKVLSTPDRHTRFHFFHTLSGVKIKKSAEGKWFVTELRFSTRGDPARLDDLSTKALDHFGCWPHDDRLFTKGGGTDKPGVKVLTIQDNFDIVVFAIGYDGLGAVNMEVTDTPAKASGPRTLVEAAAHGVIETVATQAAQVWLSEDLEGLGWHRGSGLISALGQGFDTWADMTHTLATERAWRRAAKRNRVDADRARSVAYFCGVVSEKAEKLSDKAQVDLEATLTHGMRHIWPGAYTARDEQNGKPRTPRDLVVGSVHAVMNAEGSDRYTQSLPGSIENRMSPLECPIANMTIAGDWTACGLDVGCVEAAVMSGMLAAHAITGTQPALADIIGYDHP
jgi:uncharacterized protein with NAD-binding domain and iron-sulfur cluster